MCDGARQHVNTCMVGVEGLYCSEKGERADDATKHDWSSSGDRTRQAAVREMMQRKRAVTTLQ